MQKTKVCPQLIDSKKSRKLKLDGRADDHTSKLIEVILTLLDTHTKPLWGYNYGEINGVASLH